MPAAPFTADRIKALLGRLADEIDGEWLLVGGALVAVWLDGRRSTEDIDVVGMRGDAQERFRLLEFAQRAGLPVESVNSAADFFVRQVPDWREQLVLFHRGQRATVHRPTPTLFLLLKARRLSERDLEDCRLLIERSRREGLVVDVERVCREIERGPSDPGPPDAGSGLRRTELVRMLRTL